MIVISDASPIRALHHLKLLDICQQLYGKVVVPPAVRSELLHPTSVCPAIDLTNIPFVEVVAPTLLPASLQIPAELDPGETEAIVLARE